MFFSKSSKRVSAKVSASFFSLLGKLLPWEHQKRREHESQRTTIGGPNPEQRVNAQIWDGDFQSRGCLRENSPSFFSLRKTNGVRCAVAMAVSEDTSNDANVSEIVPTQLFAKRSQRINSVSGNSCIQLEVWSSHQ